MSPSTQDKRASIPQQLNPFISHASGSPWSDEDPDVGAINEPAFRLIVNALSQMRFGAPGTSIVITGEPGSGKTHLLGRLRRRLAEDERQGQGPSVYIYVRCNASASTIWRHFRISLVNDLLQPAGPDGSRLQHLLRQNPERIDSVSSRNLQQVLRMLAGQQHVQAAAAWLRGEPLSATDQGALQVGIEADEEERSREMESRDVVNALLRLFAPTPVVICFDQVEALSTYQGDEAGFHAMGQLISMLIDGQRHLLLVSCLVSAYEDVFDRLPNGADRDRWLKEQGTLRRIEREQAYSLIKARLDSAQQLAQQREKHPQQPLWPLNPEELEPLFERTGASLPRLILQTCKKRFDELMSGTAPSPPVSLPVALRQQYDRCLAAARMKMRSQDGEKILTECLPWLIQVSGFQNLGQDRARELYAKLAFQREGKPVGIAPLYGTGVSLTNRLRKIAIHWKPSKESLLLLRNASVKPGPKGLEMLGELKNAGAREVHPTFEALAALKAIQDLITSARSGDLTQEGQTISESEVTQWILQNLDPHVAELQNDLREAKPVEPLVAKLVAYLDETKIAPADQAARDLSVPVEEILACANRHPLRFGSLSGPPPVLFEAVKGDTASFDA